MCRVFNSVLAVAAVAGLAGFASTRAPSIEGVWRTDEVAMGAPDARTIVRPEATLDIITGKHYSRVEIHARGPRPEVADPSRATADELRQAWGPVIAEAGSYDVRGNTVTMHPAVAKNPAGMAAGVFATYGYRIAGDTLWLTPQRDQRGAVVNPPTIRLTRVE
jgi:hypothetical protein